MKKKICFNNSVFPKEFFEELEQNNQKFFSYKNLQKEEISPLIPIYGYIYQPKIWRINPSLEKTLKWKIEKLKSGSNIKTCILDSSK